MVECLFSMTCVRCNCVSALFLLSFTIIFTSAFNLNWKDAYIFQDPQGHVGSYFGFTVALRRQGYTQWLVVGAPRGNSTYRKHQYIHQPGIVYQCGLRNGGSCVQLIVDPSGNRKVEGSNLQHNKNNAWLGGAIAVQNSGDRMVICAPRWKNAYNSNYYLMNGICYWTDNTTDVEASMETIMPLVDFRKQSEIYHSHVYFYYAYGEAGFTVHFPQGSNEFLLGAPGLLDWRGTVIRMRDGEFSSGSPRRRRSQGNYYFAEVPNALKSSGIPMNSYLGYSLSSGRFFSARPAHLYVSGAPRANDYKGKVYLFDFPDNHEDEDLKIIRDLDGTQMGEYFGGALCVVDLNGDHLDDLVVGAPQFSLQAANSAQLVGDEGRIYVYINGDRGSFTEITGDRMIMGNQQYGARFGTTVANVGDLNMDGYEDIAVGAPFEGTGAVYIYHGDKTGIVFDPVQKILAENIDSRLKGFGISLSNGVDVDGNHYNDIAVGAFESGHAVVLRGHPIITFQPTLATSTTRISMKTSNFSSTACLTYTGPYVPGTVDARVTMSVDLAHGRAQFVSGEFKNTNTYTYEVKLRTEELQCKDFQIEIKPSAKDPTRPVDVIMRYELANNPNADPHNRGRPDSSGDGFCMTCPVVDASKPTYITKRVAFETGCKGDICEPDLIADARFIGIKNEFILGEQPTLQMEVEVLNIGEPAFLSHVALVIPRVTPLVRIPPICHDSTDKHTSETQILVCDVGNPLERNYTINLLINTRDVPIDTKELTFTVNATSVGNEVNANDNYKELVLPVGLKADMRITGLSSQDQIVYVAQNRTFREDLMLNHSFEVWNLGPSKVETVMIKFEIPHQLSGPNGERIFMQVFQPELLMQSSSGTVSCEPEEPFFYYKPEDSSKGDVAVEVDPTAFVEGHVIGSEVAKYTIVAKRSVSSTELLQEESEYPPSSPNFIPPPSNRTLFLNCSSEKVDCFKVRCFAGPFTPVKSRALINFKLKPTLETLEPSLEKRDIILFTSRGKVSIVNPSAPVQPGDHEPDGVSVNTVFHGKIPEGSVATWIIVLAVICGILVLLLITTALHKIGFFKREKKEELQALKEGEEEVGVADGGD